jgi:Protein of unknown function (DUF5818)
VQRETSPLAALGFLVVTVPLLFGQDPQARMSPALPPDIVGPQLIAWSQLQKPQPVPQPLAPSDRPMQQTDRQSASPRAQQEQPAAPTFMGTIIKNGSRYVLKVASNSVYQLDDQDKAKQYEGEQVTITGTLDADGKSLHITSIELVS